MKNTLKNQLIKLKSSFFLKIMKAHLFLFVISLFGNVMYAGTTLAQTTISMALNDVTIETLFSEIEKSTTFVILHKENVPLNKKVSVNVTDESVEKVLEEVLSPLGLKYFVKGKQIIVAENKVTSKPQEAPRQVVQKTVTGTIVDSNNDPLIGVSVMVKGKGTGTITDMDGKYSVNVEENGILIFSFVGLTKQEFSVTGKTIINVTMKEDSQVMSELVVVGFAVQKKVNLTGSVAVVDSKILENRPVGNALQALQGAVPGLRISSNSSGGQLDADMDIKVRGDKEKIGMGSDAPLILIDGMEGSLSNINPQDIDNISVLKDAAAAAIYGSRAPNGVILVTTKSGKSGKAVISYNNNFRFNTPIHMPEMANSWEYVNFINDANYNGKGSTYYNAEHLQKIQDYMNGALIDPATDTFNPNYTMDVEESTKKWYSNGAWANSDWLNEYYKKWSKSQEHNISVSGGKENISYYLSANYQDQGGFLRHGDDNRQRYSMTGKLSAKVNEYLKLDFISRFSRIDYEKPARLTDSFFEEILRRSIPFHPIVTPDGLNDLGFIPILEEGGKTNFQNDDLSLQLKATFTPIKNLTINGEMNVRIRNNWEHSHWLPVYANYANDPERTYLNYLSEVAQWPNANNAQKEPTGSVMEEASRNTLLSPSLYANYNLSIGKHTITPMIGVQLETYKQRNLKGQRYNLISEETPVIDQTTSLDINDITLNGAYKEWAVLGLFGRINYDYDGRYLLEVNGRLDASSRYRSKKRWVTTPAVSVGWNIAREKFFAPLERYVPYLKLRASYGTLANQNSSDFYPTYQNMKVEVGKGQWLVDGKQQNTATAPNLISTLLTWEKVTTTNFGLDWGLFNNRLSGSFDLFSKKMVGLMGPGVELPAVLGADPPNVNNTDLKTTGFEIEIRWKDQIKDFSYSVTLNLADDKTKVLKYMNPTGALGKHIEGELLGNIYGYTSIGIARDDATMLAHLESLRDRRIELGLPLVGVDGLGGQSDGGLGRGLGAGDVMYKDINGDGIINSGSNTIHDKGDLSVIGNTRPRYQLSGRVDLAWKGIDFSMFWQGVLKRDHYPNDPGNGSGTNLNMLFWGATRGGVSWSTVFKEHLDYFRDDPEHPLGLNLDSYYPKPIFNTRNQRPQTLYLQNAAYLRLKNLQIGYTLPHKWTKTIGIEKVRFFGTGENLLTFTKMSKLIDPEMAGYGAKGGMVYPLSRTFAFGVNVNF